MPMSRMRWSRRVCQKPRWEFAFFDRCVGVVAFRLGTGCHDASWSLVLVAGCHSGDGLHCVVGRTTMRCLLLKLLLVFASTVFVRPLGGWAQRVLLHGAVCGRVAGIRIMRHCAGRNSGHATFACSCFLGLCPRHWTRGCHARMLDVAGYGECEWTSPLLPQSGVGIDVRWRFEDVVRCLVSFRSHALLGWHASQLKPLSDPFSVVLDPPHGRGFPDVLAHPPGHDLWHLVSPCTCVVCSALASLQLRDVRMVTVFSGTLVWSRQLASVRFASASAWHGGSQRHRLSDKMSRFWTLSDRPSTPARDSLFHASSHKKREVVKHTNIRLDHCCLLPSFWSAEKQTSARGAGLTCPETVARTSRSQSSSMSQLARRPRRTTRIDGICSGSSQKHTISSSQGPEIQFRASFVKEEWTIAVWTARAVAHFWCAWASGRRCYAVPRSSSHCARGA